MCREKGFAEFGNAVRQGFCRIGEDLGRDESVVFDAKRAAPFMVYPQKGKPYAPKLSARSAYEAEQRYFLDVGRGRAVKPILTARDARDAVALVRSLV